MVESDFQGIIFCKLWPINTDINLFLFEARIYEQLCAIIYNHQMELLFSLSKGFSY